MLCDRSQNLWISLYARLSSTFSFFRFILSLSLARIAKIVVLSYAFFTRVHPPLCHTVQFGIHFIWITKKRKKNHAYTHTYVLKRLTRVRWLYTLSFQTLVCGDDGRCVCIFIFRYFSLSIRMLERLSHANLKYVSINFRQMAFGWTATVDYIWLLRTLQLQIYRSLLRCAKNCIYLFIVG